MRLTKALEARVGDKREDGRQERRIEQAIKSLFFLGLKKTH